MDNLMQKLAAAGLIISGFIKLDDFQMVDIETFSGFFGSTDGSYSALVAADANADGTFKGYTRFFDAWKSAGIL